VRSGHPRATAKARGQYAGAVDEVRHWWSQLVNEVKVLDFRLTLELDEIHHELTSFAHALRELVEYEVLGRRA
jgi:hypothetical protein